ncbi:MAG: uracil-DNA glycosylase [Myxococcota bacterium]
MSDAVRHAVAELAGDLRAWLEYAEETGAEFLPWEPPQPRRAAPPAARQRPPEQRPHTRPQNAGAPQNRPDTRPTQSRPQTRPPQERPRTQPGPGRGSGVTSQGAALDAVRASLGERALYGGPDAQNPVVFGAGNPQAEVVIIGDGPGRDEVLTGEPFVGRSGQLLTRMLQAIGLQREDVYLCNVLKCQLTDDRAPRPEEIAASVDVLARQIEAIGPKVIIASGVFASRSLLGLELEMDAMRGTLHTFNALPVVPMYHPAFLLQHPAAKRQAYDDLLTVKSLLSSD